MDCLFLDPDKKTKTLVYLAELEVIFQEIVKLREEKLLLSNAKNKYNESLRELKKTDERNCWIKLGSVYVQRPTSECIKIVQAEIDKADVDLKDLGEKIKAKASEARDLEHQPRIEGIRLKPMSAKEAKVIRDNFSMHQ